MPALALATDRKCSSASRQVRRGRDQRRLASCLALILIARALSILQFIHLPGFEDDTPQKEQFLIAERRQVEQGVILVALHLHGGEPSPFVRHHVAQHTGGLIE